jgi:hypothetical protein
LFGEGRIEAPVDRIPWNPQAWAARVRGHALVKARRAISPAQPIENGALKGSAGWRTL